MKSCQNPASNRTNLTAESVHPCLQKSWRNSVRYCFRLSPYIGSARASGSSSSSSSSWEQIYMGITGCLIGTQTWEGADSDVECWTFHHLVHMHPVLKQDLMPEKELVFCWLGCFSGLAWWCVCISVSFSRHNDFLDGKSGTVALQSWYLRGQREISMNDSVRS